MQKLERIELSKKIRQLAFAKNVTQKTISDALGISRITTHRFFNGKTQINASHFVQMLAVLGIDINAQIQAAINEDKDRQLPLPLVADVAVPFDPVKTLGA